MKVDQERYPSLLGMDVLRNYKISFNESKVILERNSRSDLSNGGYFG
jgi:hypothetical protein